MQIKTILISHLSHSNSKDQQNNQQHPRLGVGNRGPSLSAGRIAHQCSSVGISVDNSQRLKIHLQYDPAMPLLGIYTKNSNSCSTDNFSHVPRCPIHKVNKWKPPKYPSFDEWIVEMWYLYTMEYYSAVKNNEIMNFSGK